MPSAEPMPPLSHALIAGSVVLLHAAAPWALQAGLLRRTVELVVPVQVIDAGMEAPPKV